MWMGPDLWFLACLARILFFLSNYILQILESTCVNPEMPPTFWLEVVFLLSQCAPNLPNLVFPGRPRWLTPRLVIMWGAWRRKWLTHERLAMCEDGGWRWPEENTVHILLLLKEKRHFIGKEMTPLDLLSCDIFVFQASFPTIFKAHESNSPLWSMFDCCSGM